MSVATPATTRLDELGLPYRLHSYEHDPRATAFGEEAVAALGVDADRFLKTLVTEVEPPGHAPGRRLPLACAVVPVAGKLDLRAFARALEVKRAVLADVADAERSTGYVRGGISPVGQRAPLACLVEETAMLYETVFVSAGQRGRTLELAPDDLLVAAGARYAAITVTAR